MVPASHEQKVPYTPRLQGSEVCAEYRRGGDLPNLRGTFLGMMLEIITSQLL